MKRAYTDIPEGQIHYRIEGSGEPILLLHMAVSSSDEFSRTMHFLSKKYRAIAIDFLEQAILTRRLTHTRFPTMRGR